MSDDTERDDGDDDVAVLLPVVPESLEVDPVLLALVSCAAFLDLSTEEAVDPDDAVDVLELVGAYMQRLPPDRIEELKDQLEALTAWTKKQGWPEETVEFVGDFLYNCGVAGEDDEDEDEDETEEEDESEEDEDKEEDKKEDKDE